VHIDPDPHTSIFLCKSFNFIWHRGADDVFSNRYKRERESRVWGDAIDQIGQPGEGVQLIHVCDRGADDFEVFCNLQQNHCNWVVRASSLHRKVITPDDKTMPLEKYLHDLSAAGTYEPEYETRTAQTFQAWYD
jgi:hypothetical protein